MLINKQSKITQNKPLSRAAPVFAHLFSATLAEKNKRKRAPRTRITKARPGIGRLILRVFLLVVIPIIAVVFGAQWYEKTGRYVETENAYVKTNVIAISADIDGRVTEVFVDENQLISKGDLLFKLDPNNPITFCFEFFLKKNFFFV